MSGTSQTTWFTIYSHGKCVVRASYSIFKIL